MKPSENALKLIRHFEGLRLQSYRDPGGVWTIGYGHTGDRIDGPMTIDKDEAERLLADDAAFAARSIIRSVLIELSQQELDALTSLVVNIGVFSFRKSTIARLLNTQQLKEAAGEFLRWNKESINGRKMILAGLTRRRQAERELFLTGRLNLSGSAVV